MEKRLSHAHSRIQKKKILLQSITANRRRLRKLLHKAIYISPQKAPAIRKLKRKWRGVWDLNPRGLSTTDLAGLPPTRLGQPRKGNSTQLFCLGVSGLCANSALVKVYFCL